MGSVVFKLIFKGRLYELWYIFVTLLIGIKNLITQLLDEAREITEYCDQNNWNSIWYTEHHFNHEGMESCTNPLIDVR